eukprot:1515734-Rhodomonas_salina.1
MNPCPILEPCPIHALALQLRMRACDCACPCRYPSPYMPAGTRRLAPLACLPGAGWVRPEAGGRARALQNQRPRALLCRDLPPHQGHLEERVVPSAIVCRELVPRRRSLLPQLRHPRLPVGVAVSLHTERHAPALCQRPSNRNASADQCTLRWILQRSCASGLSGLCRVRERGRAEGSVTLAR